MSKKNLQVKMFCAPVIERDPFKGEADAVSSQNRLGKFDILPEHTNFITLIFGDLTIHTADKKKIAYRFERGVLEVSEDKVNVFLGL
jgi:F0F1-type ATP synthase epsilon subunit